jgi:hypothetical protein
VVVDGEAAFVAVRSLDGHLGQRLEQLLPVFRAARLVDRSSEHGDEVVRVHRVLGGLEDLLAARGPHADAVGAVAGYERRLKRVPRLGAELRSHATRREGETVDPARIVRQLLANQRVRAARRREDRDLPAAAPRSGQHLRDRRRLGPDDQRGRAGTSGLQHLRREVGRGRRQPHLRGNSLGVGAEGAIQHGAALVAVAGVVGQQRDAVTLGDHVFGEPEADPAVGRRDAEDVRPLVGIDEPDAALVRDRDRNVRVARDPPGRVDARPLVDDRDGALRDSPSDVPDGAARREGVVHPAHLEAVASVLRLDHPDPARAELDSPRDGLADVRAAREGRVDRDRQGADRVVVAPAAPGEQRQTDEEKECLGAAQGDAI